MRLFTGEKDEVVELEDIRNEYEESDKALSFAEYLQNVTGNGGYYMAVNHCTMTLPEFLRRAELSSIENIDDTDMRLLDHSLPGVLHVVGNSDDYMLIVIVEVVA